MQLEYKGNDKKLATAMSMQKKSTQYTCLHLKLGQM